jgi:hypothetical protein
MGGEYQYSVYSSSLEGMQASHRMKA